jgi:hypothetical protein
MSFVVTLSDYTPPARADKTSYTSVRIEEAAGVAGPFTVIDTIARAADVDPEYPATRDFTTAKATLSEGFYRVTYVDQSGGTSTPSEVVQNASKLAGGSRPSIAEVASLLRARTKAIGGKEVGTFNTQTRPTADEVDNLIDEGIDEVLGKVKVPEPGTAYEGRVRGAIALYAAILIELSYFPEQVGSAKSPVASYEKLYEKRIKSLIAESITGEVDGEGGASSEPADPAWTFPNNVGGLIGWGTRW